MNNTGHSSTPELRSPGKGLNSPEKSPPRSPKKDVTRYGVVKHADIKFGTEERFTWQNATNSNDVAYDLPDMIMSRSVIFGSSLRKGMDEENPDNKKRSTGPGSYDYAHCFDHNSEYITKVGNRFGCAPRQSMAVKTPSPGAVYNIDKQFWNGREKGMGIGFPNSTRQNLYGSSLGANADMFIPKYETGNAITIASRFKQKRPQEGTPGAIYDVHKKMNFQTGPSFSFGKGKGNRFKEFGFLPEICD